MDQRRARRYEIRLPVEVVRAGGRRLSASGETWNVSSGGVLFTHHSAPVEIGQPVEYLIDLPTGRHFGGVRLRCLGTIVRRDENSQTLAATLERYEFIRGGS